LKKREEQDFIKVTLRKLAKFLMEFFVPHGVDLSQTDPKYEYSSSFKHLLAGEKD
jgi:hypothetical protein